MPIEWFPGHMATARKEAALAMRKTDVVLEVLDARVPFSSRNPLVEALRLKHQRPALKILNKADIADPALTQKWLAFYNAQPSVQALALSAKQGGAVKRIPERALALAPHRAKPAKPLRIMILGIPNVGKSTLMNALIQRNVTKVGDQPALTKSQLGHQLGPHMWLVDTPGLIPRELDQRAALKLAATHSIGPNAYDPVEVAGELARYLLDHYAEQFRSRFPLENPGPSGQEIIAAIARSRSLLVRGGEPDLERAGRTLLGEFRDGTLGRISLESPEELPEEAPPEAPEVADDESPESVEED